MSTTEQRNLFPLPNAITFEMTESKQAVLDWLVLTEHRAAPEPFPAWLSKHALRYLIHMDLVKVVGLSPGRYRITEVGRAARAKGL